MKLSIKTKDIEIEYQDDYSKIEKEVKERIEDIIKTVYEYEARVHQSKPIAFTTLPFASHNALIKVSKQ